MCGSPGGVKIPVQVCFGKAVLLYPAFGVLCFGVKKQKTYKGVRDETAGTVTERLQRACTLGVKRP